MTKKAAAETANEAANDDSSARHRARSAGSPASRREDLDEFGGGGAGREAELLDEDGLAAERHGEEDPKVRERRAPYEQLQRRQRD